MDGEGDSDLKTLNSFDELDSLKNSFPPQWTLGEDKGLEMWEDATQSADFDPVSDWISVQVQLAHTFMGIGGLSIAVAA